MYVGVINRTFDVYVTYMYICASGGSTELTHRRNGIVVDSS